MSGITLSKAVRSNLLNLQSTADLLGKSQERLSTGLRVNSALDNPTNFFTAQGLNSRANDLSQLLDSVSNAVQTVAAADKGITAITKLVESAQATARQALQTSATVSTTTAATAGTFTAGAFTSLNVSNAGSGATHGAVSAGSALSTIDLSASTPATHGQLSAGSALATIDLSADGAENATVTGSADLTAGLADGGSDITFDINGETVTLTTTTGSGGGGEFTLADIKTAINNTANVGVTATDDGNGHLVLTSTDTAGAADAIVTSGTTAAGLGIADTTVENGSDATDLTFDVNGETVTLAGGSSYDGNAIASAITSQAGVAGKVSASYSSGKLVVTSTDTAGSTDTVTIDNFSSGDEGQLGFATAAGSVTDAGDDLVPHADLTFDVNGETVTLAGGSTYDGNAVASAINAQAGTVGKVNASYSSGKLVVTSTDTAGSTDTVTIDNFSSGDEGQLGFATATGSVTDAGDDLVAADSLSFSLTVNGTAHSISISSAAVDTYNTAHSSATISAASLSAGDVANLINSQAGGTFASATSGGALKFNSSTTGVSSTIAISGFTGSATSGSTGIANNSDTGTDEVGSSGANPKRAELVATYNDLLGQIDALAKDSGFNGVNLLNDDDLSVLFNEDGSSSLAITGIKDDAQGLGLAALDTDDFDTNVSINSTLDDLKGAIETLRGQSAKFGSNLSVVETRQDFTKNMINVLQTGASNLTLADTNEEAANVLALQTRQQLSSTALSLASQADQNVLRLF